MTEDYINGYIERKSNGAYEGRITIEGITLPSIMGVYFSDEGKNYLWLKRKKILEYDFESRTYKERDASPQWEAYLLKSSGTSGVEYRGEFMFLHFRFSIVGIWDKIMGRDKHRLNLSVERLPQRDQTIINRINERRKDE